VKNFWVENGLLVSEEVGNEGIINYSDVEEVKNIGKFSFKIRYKKK
jgi:hypothetical protein